MPRSAPVRAPEGHLYGASPPIFDRQAAPPRAALCSSWINRATPSASRSLAAASSSLPRTFSTLVNPANGSTSSNSSLAPVKPCALPERSSRTEFYTYASGPGAPPSPKHTSALDVWAVRGNAPPSSRSSSLRCLSSYPFFTLASRGEPNSTGASAPLVVDSPAVDVYAPQDKDQPTTCPGWAKARPRRVG
ncbi:hypothetical protein D9615_009418 [Tricholomella constricta]|uniref:Uncharacterized protein n=1 Tax=Tricholomella constricta TaxID=117010 RepID=A0A8H5H2Q3_9AGAR|nr:hypothetical protein D9615_009418 [Tricholomella constricta]